MKKGFIQYLVAVMFIGLGTLLVLDNIGVIESDVKELWHFIYPLFFIALGLTMLYRCFSRGGGGWIFGSFLTVFGSLLLLGKLTIIPFFFSDIFKLWPLLIIYGGFSIIGFSKKNSRSHTYIYKEDGSHDKGIKFGRFSIGNIEYKQPNWQVKPMDLWNVAGDYYFDFTKAYIPEEEIPIHIFGLAGDIQMLLPEALHVRISAKVKAGEIDVIGETADGINQHTFFESPGYEEAIQKLDIILDLKAGSIRVNQV